MARLEGLAHDVDVARAVAASWGRGGGARGKVSSTSTACGAVHLSWRGALQRELDAQGVLTTAVRLLDEHVDDRLALGELGRVDEVGRAHAASPLLLAAVGVDRDDLLGLADLAPLNDGEADGAEAEDGRVVALLDVGRLGSAKRRTRSVSSPVDEVRRDWRGGERRRTPRRSRS